MADDTVADSVVAESDADTSRPSGLDEHLQLRVFKAWFRDDAQHAAEWRKMAHDDFGFVANEQWTPEERAALEAQLRVPITFNRCLSIIQSVSGSEINGRHDIRFIPRNTENTAVNEVLTGASQWMEQGCDAEDEETEAFSHALICGMGWTENRLEYDEEPDGKYIEEAISPLEMYWDATAKKKNVIDARRMWRVRKMALDDARFLFQPPEGGQYDADDLDATWTLAEDDPNQPAKTYEEKLRRDENSSGDDFAGKRKVTIVQCQWWEREVYHLVADPTSDKPMPLSVEEFAKLKQRHDLLRKIAPDMAPLSSAKMTRKVFKRAFIGAKVLEISDGPIKDRFSWACITGVPHHTKGTFFGLVAVMRDPQKWANKWLSQTLHILNASAKGGILAETDAFEDQRQAEDTWAKPEAITWMKRGALSSAGGKKWELKPTAEFPAGFFNLMEFGVSSIRDVTGINLELLGMRDATQPGILEAHRKQAAMTILAPLFDSLRRFRKTIGRMRLYYIQNFLADNRLIRIAGIDGAKAVRLVRDHCLGEYDVIVDDAPTSPNQKEANWAIIREMLPAFKDQLVQRPDLLVATLEQSPLPFAFVEKIKLAIAKSGQDPQAEQMKQLAVAGAVAKISKDQAQAELFNKQAGATEATAMYDMAMAQNLLLKHQGDMVAALNEAQQQGLKAGKLAAETAHTAAKVDTETATAEGIRAETAATHAGIGKTVAQTHATHIDALHQALQPIHHSDADTGGPAQPLPVSEPVQ